MWPDPEGRGSSNGPHVEIFDRLQVLSTLRLCSNGAATEPERSRTEPKRRSVENRKITLERGITYTAGRISNAIAAFTRQRPLVRTQHRPLWEGTSFSCWCGVTHNVATHIYALVPIGTYPQLIHNTLRLISTGGQDVAVDKGW